MKSEMLSTEELPERLRLRRCTDAERVRAETGTLNGPAKERKINALDIVRRLEKIGRRF